MAYYAFVRAVSFEPIVQKGAVTAFVSVLYLDDATGSISLTSDPNTARAIQRLSVTIDLTDLTNTLPMQIASAIRSAATNDFGLTIPVAAVFVPDFIRL